MEAPMNDQVLAECCLALSAALGLTVVASFCLERVRVTPLIGACRRPFSMPWSPRPPLPPSSSVDRFARAFPGLEVRIVVESFVGSAERHIRASAQDQAACMIIVGRRELPAKQLIHEGGTIASLVAFLQVPLLIVPLREGR
jgi:hypothetical protein